MCKILTLTDRQLLLKNKVKMTEKKSTTTKKTKIIPYKSVKEKVKNTQPVASLSADSYVS